MVMASIAADIVFHSDKNCFVLLESKDMLSDDTNELRYFSIISLDWKHEKSVYVAGYLLNSRQHRRSRLFINGMLANCLGLNLNDQVLVTPLNEPIECFGLNAEPLSIDDWEVVEMNAEKIEEQLLVQTRLIYAGMEFPIWIDGGYCIFLRIVSCETGTTPYGLLVADTEITIAPKFSSKRAEMAMNEKVDDTASMEKNVEGKHDDDQNFIARHSIHYRSPSVFLRGIKTFDLILDKLLWHANLIFSPTDAVFIGYPLIIGSMGAGRSTLASAMCEEMVRRGLVEYTSVIECKLLKGKAVESVEKRLKDKISDAIKSQPAAIVLDDLDRLCSSCSTMEQITPGASMLYERLSRTLANSINDVRRRRDRILFVATCRSMNNLNQFLILSRGIRYFDAIAEIPELDYFTRKAVIDRLINGEFSIDTPIPRVSAWVSNRTSSYVLADFKALVERASIHFEYEQGNSVDEQALISCFKGALMEFSPLAFHGSRTSDPKRNEISFNDIGGLNEAKAILEKIFHLPARYPKIFANLPIRLPHGALLYGPSGCGKTLLAAAVANDFGLSTIHVKGAELLSKYIGASEQSVRDVFSRAKSRKPCLIVFDEFDALAPRRGHDSTGVTDRVVNQLLTEMDGVEGLEGVYILAASSRPDLIDPALLRPGRIDKRVYCGMPTPTERHDILVRLSELVTLEDGVDLDTISKQTDGFSGADLKSILLDAHLLAMRKASENDPVSTNSAVVRCIRITQDHLSKALALAKPSVSTQERQRFAKIYDDFRNDTNDSNMIKFDQDNVGKRATLA